MYQHWKADHADAREYDCVDCDQRVQATGNEIIKHLQTHVNVYEFHCIYCKQTAYGTNDVRDLREHLAVNHPERFLIAASRCIQQNIPNWLSFLFDVSQYETQEMLNSYQCYRFPNTVDLNLQLNRMDPNLSAIDANRNSENDWVRYQHPISMLGLLPNTKFQRIDDTAKLPLQYSKYLDQRVDTIEE